MGFRAKQPGNQVSRDSWSFICSGIAKDLAEDRDNFYQFCIEVLGKSSKTDPLLRLTAQGSKMPDPTDDILKAWQFNEVIRIMNAKNYMAPRHGKEFMELLLGQVGGVRVDQTAELGTKYFRAEAHPQKMLVQFASDLLGTMVEGAASSINATALAIASSPALSVFTLMARARVAGQFGDAAVVSEVTTGIRRGLSGLTSG